MKYSGPEIPPTILTTITTITTGTTIGHGQRFIITTLAPDPAPRDPRAKQPQGRRFIKTTLTLGGRANALLPGTSLALKRRRSLLMPCACDACACDTELKAAKDRLAAGTEKCNLCPCKGRFRVCRRLLGQKARHYGMGFGRGSTSKAAITC